MNLLLDTLTQDLELICAWLKHNRLIVNWSKTNAMLFNFKSKFSLNQSNIDLSFDSNPIPFVESVKLLGVILDNKLKFDQHNVHICKQINSKTYLLSRSNFLFPLAFRSTLFKIFIQTKFDYCSTLFIHLSSYIDNTRLETCFNNSIKKILNIKIRNLDHSKQIALLKPFNILPIKLRRFEHFSSYLKTLVTQKKATLLLSYFEISQFRSCYKIPHNLSNFSKYSFTTISSKILNLFLHKQLHTFKTQFSLYFKNNIQNLYLKSKEFWT